MEKTKQSFVQTILTTLYVVCLLIANIVASKQVQLPLGVTMTGAIFVFPLTYILSDVFSEVYGYRWSRVTCIMAFLCNIFMVAIFALVIVVKPPVYWTNQEAFAIVLGNTPRMLFASLVAYFMGDWVNDLVFRGMKNRHGKEKFGRRAIVSSFFGEFVDSLIFVPIAFIGAMPAKQLLVMIAIQPTLKVVYEVIILPLTKLAVKTLNKYEGQA